MHTIDDAFRTIGRADFLPPETADMQYADIPLPIGYGQTNSQPATVRLMLEWLDPLAGERVLDVGSGSGWTTAMLSYLVGDEGRVYAVERIPELVAFGTANCRRAGCRNVEFHESGPAYGLPKSAPYDRILVSAAAKTLPHELLDQLDTGGRLVIPIGQSVYVINKTDDTSYRSTEHPGFAFVPLVE